MRTESYGSHEDRQAIEQINLLILAVFCVFNFDINESIISYSKINE